MVAGKRWDCDDLVSTFCKIGYAYRVSCLSIIYQSGQQVFAAVCTALGANTGWICDIITRDAAIEGKASPSGYYSCWVKHLVSGLDTGTQFSVQ